MPHESARARAAAWEAAARAKRIHAQHERVRALTGLEPEPAPELPGQMDLLELIED